MAAYLIGQVTAHDVDRFAPYVQKTSALIEQYDGEVIDVVQAIEAVEGSWPEPAKKRQRIWDTNTLWNAEPGDSSWRVKKISTRHAAARFPSHH